MTVIDLSEDLPTKVPMKRTRREPLEELRDVGPLTDWTVDTLLDRNGHTSRRGVRRAPRPHVGSGLDLDTHLALYLAYEGHFSSLPGVAPHSEWLPELVAARRLLEAEFLRSLRGLGNASADEAGTSSARRAVPGVVVRDTLLRIVADDDGPSLSGFMEQFGSAEQMSDVVMHRSLYQLKEGDAHSCAIPRIAGRAKQILVQIQAGEYGADAPNRRTHAALFADTMDELGLDARPHAYLDRLPASSFILSNVISMFGLNRRWRGALVGHLAYFEMTSVQPMARYSRALDRMGASPRARKFYDVHVQADAEHELMALDMAAALVEDEPELFDDVVFGARCACAIEALFAHDLFRKWCCADGEP